MCSCSRAYLLAGSAQTVAVSAREDLTVAGASGTHGQHAIAHTLELRAAAADAGRGLLASSYSQHQPLELQRELLHVLVLDDDGDAEGAELLIAPRKAWLATAGAEATYTVQLSGTTGRALRQDDRAYPVRVVPSVRAVGACAESGAACDPWAPAPQEACARCVPLGPAAILIEVEPAWALLTRANESEPVQFRVRTRAKSPLARSLLGAALRIDHAVVPAAGSLWRTTAEAAFFTVSLGRAVAPRAAQVLVMPVGVVRTSAAEDDLAHAPLLTHHRVRRSGLGAGSVLARDTAAF